MDAPLYMFRILPSGNASEFPELEAEALKRAVHLEFRDILGGDGGIAGRIYRVPSTDLHRLHRDERGPYLGTEDSGHFLTWVDPSKGFSDAGKWQRVGPEPLPEVSLTMHELLMIQAGLRVTARNPDRLQKPEPKSKDGRTYAALSERLVRAICLYPHGARIVPEGSR